MLGSRDIEDVLNLIDGRAELGQELLQAADDVKDYLRAEFKALLNSADISYAVQSTAGGDVGREQLIFERMEKVCDEL